MASKIGSVIRLQPEDWSSLFNSLEVTIDNRDDFMMKMSRTEWDTNMKVREAVQYLGFGARQIIAQFYKKAAENPAAPTDEATIPCGDVKLYEKNHAKTDLLFFINVFLERGNNISKAALKCDANAGALLRRKAQAYGIVIDPVQNKTIVGTKSLTLSRLAQAFSVCTAAVIIDQFIYLR